MPNYDIYILPESDITISGGEQLDGVTQGDGSHLVGEVITLNTNNWRPINITDNNTDFADSQGSNQTITNTETIDGQTFGAGTNVEAEYAIVVSDGTNTYTVIAFNFSTGSPAYATVEALAFIGPVGGFPPVGVPLTVISSQEGPSNPAEAHASPPCFTTDTLIQTPEVPRFVQDIRAGDLVETQTEGPQPVRWVGRGTYAARGRFAPICFKAGVLGNTRDLILSPQHRIQFVGWQAEYLLGEPAGLIPAHCFVNDDSVQRVEGGFVTYFHLMFDAHQIIFSEGVATESYFARGKATALGAAQVAEELADLFPECCKFIVSGKTILPSLKPYEARVLLSLAS
ncbi:Hint domain-containing protein [Litoreibacter roseus]|uniref:Hedgehog/Intein (Hint) domain-containing protein n=1 Tax=Litoreibacter roseus TaxID=2601869 RepID=A0A6N6JLS6_9RHOB|nr:Hint domain-containing protein [Litoreibacter roseus]GFE66927.1 hypothetical protein KIN_40010 [Litoreibacter roseus]